MGECIDRGIEWLVWRSRRQDLIERDLDPDTPEARQFIKRPCIPLALEGKLPCSVYKCYDQDGDLLYVGVTGAGTKRAKQHYENKVAWWLQMVRQEWEHYFTREEALAREAELIVAENPLYNVYRPIHKEREA